MDNSQDNATALTKKYLSILEHRVGISWNASQQPQILVGEIGNDSIEDLRLDLHNLFNPSNTRDAIESTKIFGSEHIQTLGFGTADDLDTLIKIGFLLGERVVIWDIIFSRILSGPSTSPVYRSSLAQIACNLVILRPLVEIGAVVILPHPIQWSEEALEADQRLRLSGNYCPFKLGVTIALIANEAGLQLHPYTQAPFAKQPQLSAPPIYEEGAYSHDAQLFHGALASLFKNREMAYLSDVSASKFYEIIQGCNGFKRDLRRHLMLDLRGLSPQESEDLMKSCHQDLAKLIAKQNEAVYKYLADGGEATVLLLLASVGDYFNLVQLKPLALAVIATRFCIMGRKWFSRPEENVLVQGFRQMCDSGPRAAETIETEVTDSIIPPNEDINSLLNKFNDYHWTEDRHNMLLDLPLATSKNLLRHLEKDDIARIVNYRNFQADYIGDYLSDLRFIDRDSFWQHVEQVFLSNEGILIYDGDDYVDTLCSEEIPDHIWTAIINSLIDGNRAEIESDPDGYASDLLARIIAYQTEESESFEKRREYLVIWCNSLPADSTKVIVDFLRHVFTDATPTWLKRCDAFS